MSASPRSMCLATFCLLMPSVSAFSQVQAYQPELVNYSQARTPEELLRSFKDQQTVTVTVPVLVTKTRLVPKCITVCEGVRRKRPVNYLVYVEETITVTETVSEQKTILTEIDNTQFAKESSSLLIPNRHPLTSPDISILARYLGNFLRDKSLVDSTSPTWAAPGAKTVAQLTKWTPHSTKSNREIRHYFEIRILNDDNLMLSLYIQSRQETTINGVPDPEQITSKLSELKSYLSRTTP
jgi:hypothetical protein